MHNNKDTTYSEAIEKVMLNNGYFAPLKLLYKEIWQYKDKNIRILIMFTFEIKVDKCMRKDINDIYGKSDYNTIKAVLDNILDRYFNVEYFYPDMDFENNDEN